MSIATSTQNIEKSEKEECKEVKKAKEIIAEQAYSELQPQQMVMNLNQTVEDETFIDNQKLDKTQNMFEKGQQGAKGKKIPIPKDIYQVLEDERVACLFQDCKMGPYNNLASWKTHYGIYHHIGIDMMTKFQRTRKNQKGEAEIPNIKSNNQNQIQKDDGAKKLTNVDIDAMIQRKQNLLSNICFQKSCIEIKNNLSVRLQEVEKRLSCIDQSKAVQVSTDDMNKLVDGIVNTNLQKQEVQIQSESNQIPKIDKDDQIQLKDINLVHLAFQRVKDQVKNQEELFMNGKIDTYAGLGEAFAKIGSQGQSLSNEIKQQPQKF